MKPQKTAVALALVPNKNIPLMKPNMNVAFSIDKDFEMTFGMKI